MENIQQTLLVKRDGLIDDEYYAAELHTARVAALQQLGRETLHLALTAPVNVGKGIVWLMTHETQNV